MHKTLYKYMELTGENFHATLIKKYILSVHKIYQSNILKIVTILGIQANLWTERIETEDRLDYMLFPRIAALAENAWTKEMNKNINSFNIRLKKINLIYIRKIISTIQILLPLKRPENQLDKINNPKK